MGRILFITIVELFTIVSSQTVYFCPYGDFAGAPLPPLASCGGTDAVGRNVTPRSTTDTGNVSYTNFLMTSVSVDCYGVIEAWEFEFSQTACHNIRFQVWRPLAAGNSSYVLVGENFVNFEKLPGCGPKAFSRYYVPVERAYQIPTAPGDVIGWVDVPSSVPLGSSRLFHYDQGASGSVQFDTLHIRSQSSSTVGQLTDWGVDTVIKGRAYSLKAYLEPLRCRVDFPTFDNLPTYAWVSEGSTGRYNVLTAVASNDRNWNDVYQVPITYSQNAWAWANVFDLDQNTGDIYTTGFSPIDYETMRNTFLEVEATQGVYTSAVGAVNLHIDDVNERHYLTNLPAIMTLSAQTIVTLPFQVFTVTHNDPDDESLWENKTYSMVCLTPEAGGVFDIISVPGLPMTGAVRLTTNISLWRWSPYVTLLISCHDDTHSAPPLTLNITITDILTEPVLTNLPAVVTIAEAQSTPQRLYTVKTSQIDPRLPNNSYLITSVTPASQHITDGAAPFSINATTGEISYTGPQPLDHISIPTYEVEVMVVGVTSQGRLYNSSRANLTVEVTWVNQAPYFINTAYWSKIPELVPAGNILPGVLINANDRDLPVGDWLTFDLVGSQANALHVDNVTRTVRVLSDLTCEAYKTETTLVFTVHVKDSKGLSALPTATLTLVLTDVNNHNPVFSNNTCSGSVNETDVDFVVISSILVDDQDGGWNRQLDLSISDPVASLYFEPRVTSQPPSGPWTVDIVLRQSIDAYQWTQVNFTLLAVDRGSPSLGGSTAVSVGVVDVNDHPPVFEPGFVSQENSSLVTAGDIVATLDLLDHDLDGKLQVYFAIPTPGFSLLVLNGQCRVYSSVQFHAYDTYLLYIMATDEDYYSSSPLTVRIDTYSPPDNLIDIHMHLPLAQFLDIKQDFLGLLSQALHPWVFKEDQSVSHRDQSIITVYAIVDNFTYDFDQRHGVKTFIEAQVLLHALRATFTGDPVAWLTQEPFELYQVYLVEPTYPKFWTQTVTGVTLLTLLCVGAAVAWILTCVLLLKNNKSQPASDIPLPALSPPADEPQEELFDFRYERKENKPLNHSEVGYKESLHNRTYSKVQRSSKVSPVPSVTPSQVQVNNQFLTPDPTRAFTTAKKYGN